MAGTHCRMGAGTTQLTGGAAHHTGQKDTEFSVAKKTRLDLLVVERGLAPSRERARALILAGRITADGQTMSKAYAPVSIDDSVVLASPDHPYVGRGGVKLAAALDAFRIVPTGRRALDIGASTGGFTDVLLQRGAVQVIALDVGHGQL